MNRQKVESMISIRLAQAVILCNHLKVHEYKPHEGYVNEKANTFPILDDNNQYSMNQLVNILNDRYGLDIPRRSWG